MHFYCTCGRRGARQEVANLSPRHRWPPPASGAPTAPTNQFHWPILKWADLWGARPNASWSPATHATGAHGLWPAPPPPAPGAPSWQPERAARADLALVESFQEEDRCLMRRKIWLGHRGQRLQGLAGQRQRPRPTRPACTSYSIHTRAHWPPVWRRRRQGGHMPTG